MSTVGAGRTAIHVVVDNLIEFFGIVVEDRETFVYFLILLTLLTMGLVGPWITPYEYDQRFFSEDGQLLRTAPPSMDHLLGTTSHGQDVLSRILYGARPTMITGVLGGTIIVVIGTAVGMTAGYMGGRIDGVLMRITDMFYSVPLIPAAIVIVGFFQLDYLASVIIIGMVLWRGSARVIRAQVLQIKERPYVMAARAAGASPFRIIVKEILPNVLSMAILFLSLGIGFSIVVQASLAFIGIVSPFIPSWGLIVRNAYNSGLMAVAWWWTLPPALLISLTVLSTFMFGRKYEELIGAGTDEETVMTGG